MIERGAVGVVGGRIAFVGPETELPCHLAFGEEINLEGRLVTPGLIDCHTHLVFAGDRCHEFEQRLAGASYEAIAAAGGGVHATVRATRAATDQDLAASAGKRLQRVISDGVTTVEIKSGYGLELETELRMLRVARRLAQTHTVDVVTTLLAAHVVPVDRDRHEYLRSVTEEIIPRAAAEGLADAVDVFCETMAFTPEETRHIFQCARECGLPVKLHADQLSDTGGASLAAEFAALSADHLEWTNNEGAAALGRSGTVAVLLPGAYFNLRERRPPPLQALRDAGAHIAVATDCNPGTSPLLSILAAMNLAAVQFGLTVTETVAAVTREAAHALGRQSEIGSLVVGKRADMAIWNLERPAELVYWLGASPLHARIWRGN